MTLWTVALGPWDSPGKNTRWIAMPSSRGSSSTGIEPASISCIGRFLTTSAPGEALIALGILINTPKGLIRPFNMWLQFSLQSYYFLPVHVLMNIQLKVQGYPLELSRVCSLCLCIALLCLVLCLVNPGCLASLNSELYLLYPVRPGPHFLPHVHGC